MARSYSNPLLNSQRAPFALRCGALLVDYTLLLLPVAIVSISVRLFGGGSGVAGRTFGESLAVFGYVMTIVLFVLNFIALAGVTGRTLGKWATGLRVERTNGERLGFVGACLRHLVGYSFTIITLGFGYLLAALRADGRALHDFIASTAVVLDARSSRQPRPAQATRNLRSERLQ